MAIHPTSPRLSMAILSCLTIALGSVAVATPAGAVDPGFAANAVPLIGGVAQQGGPLTVVPGGYTQEPDDFDFQWYADGQPVGTDSPVFRPTADEVGTTISVQVTAHHAGDPDAVTQSVPSLPVIPGGEVMGWGDLSYGQAQIPVPVQSKTIVAVAAGYFQSLALDSDGVMYAWGHPFVLRLHGTYVAIAANFSRSLALDADGHLTSWRPDGGPLETLPESLDGKTVVAMAAGQNHSLALTDAGQVIAWGENEHGETDVPVALADKTVVAVAAGGYHSLALTSDGKVFAWGDNTGGMSDVPDSLDGVTVIGIAAGGTHSLVVTAAGQVVSWGGAGYQVDEVPPSVADMDVVAVAAGAVHSLALGADGHVAVWGMNQAGQTAIPESVSGTFVSTVTAGFYHSLAIAPDLGPGSFTVDPPSISGLEKVGEELTCAASEGMVGTPSFAWVRGETELGSGSTYTPVADDLDEVVTCVMTVARDGYTDATNRASTGTIGKGSFTVAPPSITGVAQVGEELSCAASDDLEGTPSFTWTRGETDLGSGSTYTPDADDLGSAVRCSMTVPRVGYEDATSHADTDPVGMGSFTVADPTITGDPEVGQTLSCGSDEPGAVYAWLVDGDPAGTGDAYLVVPSDVGKTVTCTVTVTREGYADATASAEVGPVGAAPAREVTVMISGTPLVGKKLRGAVSGAAPSATVTWQWLRDGKPVAGATDVVYELEPGDHGHRFRLRATVAEPGHLAGTARSDATEPVELRALRLEVDKDRVRVGQDIVITVSHLVPGERWTLTFPRSTWSVRGTAPADSQTLTRKVRIPDDLKKVGDRLLTIMTKNPDRQDAVPLVLVD